MSDGQTFTITDGTITVTFELDDRARNAGTALGRVPVPYCSAQLATCSAKSTTDQIAAALVAAIQSTALQGLTPVNQGAGTVTLGEPLASTSSYAANVSATGLWTVGAPGVDSDKLDGLADVIVAAIRSAPLSGLKPVNAGLGVVLLGEPTDGTSRHSLDVSQSGFNALGTAGTPAAIPVPVKLYTEDLTQPDLEQLRSFDGTQVAVSLRRAIESSSLDVTPVPAGGDVVLVQEALQVTDLNDVFFSNERRLGVKDRAGNPIKANLLTGDTQMTIFVGDVNAVLPVLMVCRV